MYRVIPRQLQNSAFFPFEGHDISAGQSSNLLKSFWTEALAFTVSATLPSSVLPESLLSLLTSYLSGGQSIKSTDKVNPVIFILIASSDSQQCF